MQSSENVIFGGAGFSTFFIKYLGARAQNITYIYIYIYMISETIEYINHSFERTKQEHNNVNDVMLKSDFWINILLIQKNQNIKNINNIYERKAKEYIQL